MIITNEEYKNYLLDLTKLFEYNKEKLCELDRKIGDGDHGITMNIGYQAIDQLIRNQLKTETDIAKISVAVGKVFLEAVGSSVGPLYASGFLKSALMTKNLTELNDEKLYAFWISFSRGIKDRGKAEVGDKTMIDTLEPFYLQLEKDKGLETSFDIGFENALKKAKEGMESTEYIVSNKGRSKRLGYRSKGTKDPGAVSSYLMIKEFQNYI